MRRLSWFVLCALVVGVGWADPLTDRQRIIHYLDRAGFGATPGEVQRIEDKGFFFYTEEQLNPDAIDDSNCQRRLGAFASLRMKPYSLYFNYMGKGEAEGRARRNQPVAAVVHEPGEVLSDLVGQRLIRAVYSQRQLQEVMVDFWMNHFNIDWDKGQDRWLLDDFEQHVVRRHALGRFRDLLGATAHSPAMMIYLDNWQSTAVVPGAKPKGGLNENYARELMELHTLGVDGGYTQHDVIEVARCLTGWTVGRAVDGWPFKFDPKKHDQGTKVVLGVTIPAGGGEHDGEMVLDMLAKNPSTAHFLATELCKYFVSDTPPPHLVNEVAAVYLRTDGDIADMVRTILESPEFFAASTYRSKVKSPLFLVASALRASGADLTDPRAVQAELRRLGMAPYQCEPPTGYQDDVVTWVSTGSLLERLNFCLGLAENHIKGVHVDLGSLGRELTGGPSDTLVDRSLDLLMAGEVNPTTRQDLEALAPQATPGSPALAQLVGMVLGCPDFQRR